MSSPSRTVSRRRRVRPAVRLLPWAIVVAMSCQQLAWAQSGHDMQSMPAMKMEHAPAVAPPDGKKDGKKKARAASRHHAPHPAGETSRHETAATPARHEPAVPPDDGQGMEADGQMPGMDHGQMQGMDHEQMPGMDHGQMADMGAMDMGAMRMQGGEAPPDARDPDYSDGVSPGPMTGMEMFDDASRLRVLLDRFETGLDERGSQRLDAQAWFGGDRDKLWLKLDGGRDDGRLAATRVEALWDRAVAPYWDFQLGLRHDLGDGPSRDWVALGVQGLAPYWLEVEATGYLGPSGRTALRLEAEYEILLTQRLVLQPDFEVDMFGRNDARRGIGSGLSGIDFGLRLRYEFTRKFAPYIGVAWSRKFGNTADYARAAGDDIHDTMLVAGVRVWF